MKWDWSWDNRGAVFMILVLALALDLAVIYQFTPEGKFVKPKQIHARVVQIDSKEMRFREGRYRITIRLQGYKQEFRLHLFKYELDLLEQIVRDIRVGDEIQLVVNNFRRKIMKKARIVGLQKGAHVYRHAILERYKSPFPWPSFIVSSVIFFPVFIGASFLILAATLRVFNFARRGPADGN